MIKSQLATLDTRISEWKAGAWDFVCTGGVTRSFFWGCATCFMILDPLLKFIPFLGPHNIFYAISHNPTVSLPNCFRYSVLKQNVKIYTRFIPKRLENLLTTHIPIQLMREYHPPRPPRWGLQGMVRGTPFLFGKFKYSFNESPEYAFNIRKQC